MKTNVYNLQNGFILWGSLNTAPHLHQIME